MRIGLTIEHYDPRRGGVEQWTDQFARQLLRQGHEVHVLARRFATAPSELVRHVVDISSSRLAFAEAAARRWRELALDIVHDTGCGWHCDVFQPHGGSRGAAMEQNVQLLPKWLRAARRRCAPWLPRYREFAELSRRQYVDDGRQILALSRMVAADLQRFEGVAPHRVRIVYNGVDTERFTPDKRAEHREIVRGKLGLRDEVLLLIAAHNFRLKGVPTLLRAAARLRRSGHNIHVAVAGGKRIAPYARMARRLEVESQVTFLGPVADVAPYYAAADVYVQPTHYDPCSLVVLEALASGLPVVTTRVNGAGELITPGVEGHILAEPDDDDALAKVLAELAESPVAREHMAAAARRLALQHTLADNCRELLGVYDEILRARDARRPNAA